MMTFKFFARVGIFLLLIYQPATDVFSCHQNPLDEFPNYVVIGAFSVHTNAVKFTSQANKMHLHAKFEMNPYRNLYYVYVMSTADRDRAIEEAKRLRSETKYSDTWVYHGSLGKMPVTLKTPDLDINPVTENKMEQVKTTDADHVISNTTESSSTTDPVKETETTREVTPTVTTEDPSSSVAGKPFFFKLYRAVDNASVNGEVDVIDTDRTRKVGTYQGNTLVKLSSPQNKSGDISLVCEVFGYRKVQKNLNYNSPDGSELERDENGNIVVPFELVRLQKGDIAVMYNVYFFKDAGVMRPESRYEVESLLEMLRENPNYKIKIHGHTNGGAAGKIISMGDNKNFFSLTGTKEGFGSAKKLSEERAHVIREYLVSNGIDPKRMHVKAWGGKRPIHDKHHTRAAENVRVEIEILED